MGQAGMPRADFVTSLFLIAFGTGLLWGALAMPRFEQRKIDPLSVPGIVPGFLAVVLLILAVFVLIRSIRQGGYRLGRAAEVPAAGPSDDAAAAEADDTVTEDPEAEDVGRGLFSPANGRMLLALAMGLIYAVGLVGAMPFWLATFIFVTAFIVVFEWHRWRRDLLWLMAVTAILQGAAIAAAVTLIFQELFLVTLP